MSLEEHIKERSREIHTENYSMSIGEILSVYESKELDIHPDFQRFFRWSDLQKTKLIESILIGIPIPTIFVSQREDGVWDVIDGVQRLSTILQFAGVLRSADDEEIPPLVLEKTEYLPDLEKKRWHDFPQALKLDFKRKRFDFQIIQRESDANTKYDLFQRLNTLGSTLSPQELRNCLLIMIKKDWYEWLKSLSQTQNFMDSIGFSEKQIIEKWDMEIALRFLVFYDADISGIKSMVDVGDFLTSEMKHFAMKDDFDLAGNKEIFDKTFKYIKSRLGEETFHRYDTVEERFKGCFLISAFETIAFGVAYNIKHESIVDLTPEEFTAKVKGLWSDSVFVNNSGSGSNAKTRIPKLTELGRKMFKRNE